MADPRRACLVYATVAEWFEALPRRSYLGRPADWP